MYLIFDTETTTFPQKNLPPDHPNQARIVQIAWVVLDENLKERSCFKSLVKLSEGIRISDGAFSAHGISQEECQKYGNDIDDILCLYSSEFYRAKKVVAHNLRFDKQLVDIEFGNYHGVTPPSWNGNEFCTMEALTPICQLPNSTGRGGKYKWPKLSEAYEFITKKPLEGAHDALVDVRACAEVFKWLVQNGKVS